MMREELVTQQKWISKEKFMRVYAVYQILPGPEAMELACYFGYLTNGRIGAFLGGLGFLLPGFSLLLLWSYIYLEHGVGDTGVSKTFHCLNPVVAALICRACYKLGGEALMVKHTKDFSFDRGFICVLNFFTAVIGLNFFITLTASGFINYFFETEFKNTVLNNNKRCIGWFIGACVIGFFVLYCQLNGVPSVNLIGGNIGTHGTSLSSLFELGLIAGMVSFGGAYVTLPFIYAAAVVGDQWLTERQFLDALAITNVLPCPLVTFVTMVGWVGHGIAGAVVMTIGIFLPAFSFTIIGHEFFELVVHIAAVHPFLDGIGAAVIGFLALTAFQFIKAVIVTGIDAVVFFLALGATFMFTDKYTQPGIILVAAIAGQILYDN